MATDERLEYERLVGEHHPTVKTWDAFVREALVESWLAAYRATTEWTTEVLEIADGDLVYLFDA